MRDGRGREISYMRLSITDRCDLRCRYCMPEGIVPVSHAEILTYEELLRVASCAVALGITRFKVTGGEPLVRRGCSDFTARLKALPGVEQVTLTTNGLALDRFLPELARGGLDGVNISLDALDSGLYRYITGYAGPIPDWTGLLDRCIALGLRTKVNVVLLEENRSQWTGLAALAAGRRTDVRFIERMPLGAGFPGRPVEAGAAVEALKERWPDLHPVKERRGNGPARYLAAGGLRGRIGLIAAMSQGFCAGCNRVRLTSQGWLKPCLCYGEGTDLRALLRGGGTDGQLCAAIAEAVAAKPAGHCFSSRDQMTEHRPMGQIGG